MEAAVQRAQQGTTRLEKKLGSSLSRPQGIGSDLFADDAVWNDWGVRFVGRDDIIFFLQMWSMTSGSASFRDLESYGGRSGGTSTEAVWGMSGWTRTEPSRWIAEWQLRDGRVASVILLADLSTMEPGRFPPGVSEVSPAVPREIRDLTSAYADAWSSGDPAAVNRLYAPGAVREDMVFGDHEKGRDDIGAFASRFREWYPDATFAVMAPYGVGEPAVPGRPVVAAELTIAASDADGSPCTVKTVVFLETKNGLIASERVYYDADSLIACGWAK
jgi:ketosteroid isomerase-like protein